MRDRSVDVGGRVLWHSLFQVVEQPIDVDPHQHLRSSSDRLASARASLRAMPSTSAVIGSAGDGAGRGSGLGSWSALRASKCGTISRIGGRQPHSVTPLGTELTPSDYSVRDTGAARPGNPSRIGGRSRDNLSPEQRVVRQKWVSALLWIYGPMGPSIHC